MDRARLLSRLVDANDGILATAGVVEGLTGGGRRVDRGGGSFAATVAGRWRRPGPITASRRRIAMRTSELIAEQRRELARSQDELAELVAY